MKVNSPFSAKIGQLPPGLQNPGFVIGRHQRNKPNLGVSIEQSGNPFKATVGDGKGLNPLENQ